MKGKSVSPPHNSPKLSYKPFIKCIYIYMIWYMYDMYIPYNEKQTPCTVTIFWFFICFSSINHHVFQTNHDEISRLHLRGSLRSLHFLLPLPLFLLRLLSDDFWRWIGRWGKSTETMRKKTKMGGSTWFNRNFCSLIFVKTYPMRVPPGGIAGFFWRCKSSVRRSWPKLHKLHLTQIWISDFSKNALFSDKIRWRWRFWSALTFHWPRPWDDTWAVGTGAN